MNFAGFFPQWVAGPIEPGRDPQAWARWTPDESDGRLTAPWEVEIP